MNAFDVHVGAHREGRERCVLDSITMVKYLVRPSRERINIIFSSFSLFQAIVRYNTHISWTTAPYTVTEASIFELQVTISRNSFFLLLLIFGRFLWCMHAFKCPKTPSGTFSHNTRNLIVWMLPFHKLNININININEPIN